MQSQDFHDFVEEVIEKNDIAEIDIKEEDLKYLPNGMNVKRNEQIKA